MDNLEKDEKRPLKVCHTCGHWIYTFKGLCQRQGQGVGKFWFCEEWTKKPAGQPERKNGTH